MTIKQCDNHVCVYVGEELGRYGFGHGHPFGPRRSEVFWEELIRQGLDKKVCKCAPVMAQADQVELFHTHEYVEFVKAQSEKGDGYLDYGDTPAFPGVYEASLYVVGSVLDGINRIMEGLCKRAFSPVAGLHHARQGKAGGFCVFNDCAVACAYLRKQFGIRRVAYVDIDAHHGDGVFYGYEDDPDLIFADIHEDGRYLYPGTGHHTETGKGDAEGTKLNIPLPPGSGDDIFMESWEVVMQFLEKFKPEFFVLQCGADSLAGDPITHMQYSFAAHAHAAKQLCGLADKYANGCIIGLGGGGYNLDNIAKAWAAVVNAFL